MSEKTLIELEEEYKYLLERKNSQMKQDLGYNTRSKLNDTKGNNASRHELTEFGADFTESRQREGLDFKGKPYETLLNDLKRGYYKHKR